MDAPAAPARAAFRPDAVRLGVFLLAVAAGLWLYAAHGCDSDVAHEGHSIFHWIALHWRLAAKDFQINWAICAVSAIAVSERAKNKSMISLSSTVAPPCLLQVPAPL